MVPEERKTPEHYQKNLRLQYNFGPCKELLLQDSRRTSEIAGSNICQDHLRYLFGKGRKVMETSGDFQQP